MHAALLLTLSILFLCLGLVSGCTALSEKNVTGVRAYHDLPYIDDGLDKHKLDLFVPEQARQMGGHEGFPIVVFVHGGGWHWGDRKALIDVYGDIGRSWAGQGIAVAVISYRLGNGHPVQEQLSDVAAAVKWVWKNAPLYGADRVRFFICGHSAGGHMAAMLALDDRWLKKQGLGPKIFKGVILWSGLYDVPDAVERAGMFARRGIWYPVFGKDKQMWLVMSPIEHVPARAGEDAPEFMVVTAERDMKVISAQSGRLVRALERSGFRVRRVLLQGEGHYHEVFSADEPDSQMLREVKAFTKA